MKQCSKCQLNKPESDFYKRELSEDGLQSWCKKCSNKARDRNKKKKPRINGTWSDPEWVRNYHREYAKSHPRTTDYHRQKWIDRKARELERLRLSDPVAYQRRLNHGMGKQIKQEKAGKYWESCEHRDCVTKAQTANRRARLRGIDGRISALVVYRLVADQDGLCALCRRSILRSFHLDHKVAFSNGGQNNQDNLQILCGPCNVRKSDK